MTSKKKEHPLVSICIPLYNASEYIEETLNKIFEQTYENIEVVVVDDHSTDGSYEILKTFESDKIKLYKNPKNGGNAARNYAFQQSKGDYIKFMDADDYCSENMIKAQLERLLNEGNENTLIFSPLRLLHPDGSFWHPPRLIDKDFSPGIELLIAIWKRKGFHCPHCHLMHRYLVEKSGGWDEKIIKNQDGEFFARISAIADKSLSVPSEYAVWRRTMKGVSNQTKLDSIDSVIDTLDITSKLLFNYDDSLEMKRICGKYIGFYVYQEYPNIKPLLPKIELLAKTNDIEINLPERKILKLLTLCFGWKTALKLNHKFKL